MTMQGAISNSFTRIMGASKHVYDQRRTDHRQQVSGFMNLAAKQLLRPKITACSASGNMSSGSCTMVT